MEVHVCTIQKFGVYMIFKKIRNKSLMLLIPKDMFMLYISRGSTEQVLRK